MRLEGEGGQEHPLVVGNCNATRPALILFPDFICFLFSCWPLGVIGREAGGGLFFLNELFNESLSVTPEARSASWAPRVRGAGRPGSRPAV